MKICAISDIHGQLINNIPTCDLLLIAGDIMPLNIQTNMPESYQWLEETFIPWLFELPCKEVVFIAGNHDFIFERDSDVVKKLFSKYPEIHYLHNESKTLYIDGEEITIYGTPYCHIYGNWAFMREDDILREKFQACPDNVDIILSHDAPYGITDVCLDRLAYTSDGHIGNKPLRERIENVKFKYLLHGHLHSSDHQLTEFKGGQVANVSLLNETYKLSYKPLLINYE